MSEPCRWIIARGGSGFKTIGEDVGEIGARGHTTLAPGDHSVELRGQKFTSERRPFRIVRKEKLELVVDAHVRVVPTHRAEPRAHWHVTRIGSGTKGRLQQMMVRVHETGDDDTARRVELR